MLLKYYIYMLSPILFNILLNLLNVHYGIGILLMIIFGFYWFVVGTQFSDFFNSFIFNIVSGNIAFIIEFILLNFSKSLNLSTKFETTLINNFSVYLEKLLTSVNLHNISSNKYFSVIIGNLIIIIFVCIFSLGQYIESILIKKSKYSFAKSLFK